MKGIIAVALVWAMVALTFWGGLIYVVFHFISKHW